MIQVEKCGHLDPSYLLLLLLLFVVGVVQEEVLLSICMGLAICNLLASLRTDNAQDYVYLSFFLICESGSTINSKSTATQCSKGAAT